MLIVDDHADSREVAAAVLVEAGFAVAEAGTFADAWKRLGELPRPSIVLMDLALPDGRGIDLLKKVRATPHLESLPILVFSASVGERQQREAQDAGSNGFVTKPAFPDDVLSAIRRALAHA